MLSRLISSRSYSAAARSSSFVAPVEEKVSRLNNGITVSSVDSKGPVSQYIIAYRAGTRYEQADEAGLVHHLRNAIGTDSKNYLGVKLLWQTGSIGGQLKAHSDRDLVVVQLTAVCYFFFANLKFIKKGLHICFIYYHVLNMVRFLAS